MCWGGCVSLISTRYPPPPSPSNVLTLCAHDEPDAVEFSRSRVSRPLPTEPRMAAAVSCTCVWLVWLMVLVWLGWIGGL